MLPGKNSEDLTAGDIYGKNYLASLERHFKATEKIEATEAKSLNVISMMALS
jgi:hypothetical protein